MQEKQVVRGHNLLNQIKLLEKDIVSMENYRDFQVRFLEKCSHDVVLHSGEYKETTEMFKNTVIELFKAKVIRLYKELDNL